MKLHASLQYSRIQPQKTCRHTPQHYSNKCATQTREVFEVSAACFSIACSTDTSDQSKSIGIINYIRQIRHAFFSAALMFLALSIPCHAETMYLYKSNGPDGIEYEFDYDVTGNGPSCPYQNCQFANVGTVATTGSSTSYIAQPAFADFRAYWIEYGPGWTPSAMLAFETCLEDNPSCNIASYLKSGTTVFIYELASGKVTVNGQPRSFAFASTPSRPSVPPIIGNPSTPVAPPVVDQNAYKVNNGSLPASAVTASATGTLGSAYLSISLDTSKVLAANKFSAGYNVYVAALVPGRQMSILSDAWFMNSKQKSWQALSVPLAAFQENVSTSTADHKITIDVLRNMNITTLIGTEIYVGYGLSGDEMLNAKRYRGVYTIKP